jgi:uncharacterized protein involved in exopolysaccharide biosynthesis/Mrp family chromosome partitioning ATPase
MNTQISPNDLSLRGVEAGVVPFDHSVGFRDLLPFLRSSWWIIALTCLSFVGAALVYIINTPPSYVARAQLITGMYDDQSEDHPTGQVIDDTVIEGQIEVVKSDDVLSATIRKLGLLDDPELAKQPPSAASIVRSWLATASSADIQAMLAFNPTQSEMSPAEKERFLIAVLRGRLWVRRVGRSSVIDIAFSSSDPDKAATIANAIAQSYIDKDVQSKSDAAMQTSQWLSGRISDLREQVIASDRAVEQFKVQGDGSQTTGGQFKLSELQSVADTYRKVYEGFLQRWAEATQRITYPVSDARFVTPATAPLNKSEPRSTIITAFAAMLGIAAGTALAAIRRAVSRRMISPSDIEKATDLPCLATITEAHAARAPKSPPFPLVAVPRTACFQGKPGSRGSRSRKTLTREFRDLKAMLASICLQKKTSVIGIVGIHEATGSTTVAANLALLFSASGSRTLLIDTCVLNPTISRYLASEGATPLIDLLNAPEPFSCLGSEGLDPLTVLPVGRFDDGVSPGDRLSSHRSSLSLSDLKRWFDITIVDLPSLADSADARAVAPLLDAVVIVARAGVTTLDGLEEGINAIQGVGGRIAGIVLNAVTNKKARNGGRR